MPCGSIWGIRCLVHRRTLPFEASAADPPGNDCYWHVDSQYSKWFHSSRLGNFEYQYQWILGCHHVGSAKFWHEFDQSNHSKERAAMLMCVFYFVVFFAAVRFRDPPLRRAAFKNDKRCRKSGITPRETTFCLKPRNRSKVVIKTFGVALPSVERYSMVPTLWENIQAREKFGETKFFLSTSEHEKHNMIQDGTCPHGFIELFVPCFSWTHHTPWG